MHLHSVNWDKWIYIYISTPGNQGSSGGLNAVPPAAAPQFPGVHRSLCCWDIAVQLCPVQRRQWLRTGKKNYLVYELPKSCLQQRECWLGEIDSKRWLIEWKWSSCSDRNLTFILTNNSKMKMYSQVVIIICSFYCQIYYLTINSMHREIIMFSSLYLFISS